MSDLCLLTANLLAQAQSPAPQIPPPSITTPATNPSCKPISPTASTTAETHPPQFSLPTLHTPHPTPQPSIRPASGSQLYQQRIAALRAGRQYTRIPANSFYSAWIHATRQPTYEQWVQLLSREAAAMARGQGSNRLTVLLGDSISQWYPLEGFSSDRFWLNQGISGDTTSGVLRRLSAFNQTRPDTIHVMVGINDLRRGATDAQVLNNLRQIMRRLRQAHPQARIIVHSILPTRLPAISATRIQRINSNLAAIAHQESVNYLDLLTYFSDGQGNLRRDLTTDGLHLSSRGYQVWQWVMQVIG